MEKDHIARVSTVIDAPVSSVWDALVNPETIKQYMFGTDVVSSWEEGSPIVWKGEWQGKSYEDKGVIQQCKPGELLQYTHFSPLSGLPDEPDNYHTVTISVTPDGSRTRLVLTQNRNPTAEAREHYEKNWTMVLTGLKKLLEE
jgi:uncharacterized protein YndB with AHSA1/START domain